MLENDREFGEKNNGNDSEEKKVKEKKSLMEDLEINKNNKNENLGIKEYKDKAHQSNIDGNNINIQSCEKGIEKTSRNLNRRYDTIAEKSKKNSHSSNSHDNEEEKLNKNEYIKQRKL